MYLNHPEIIPHFSTWENKLSSTKLFPGAKSCDHLITFSVSFSLA